MNLKGLTKLGQIVQEVAGGLTVAGPLLKAIFPKQGKNIDKVEDGLQVAAGIVVKAEAVGQALGTPGPEKLTATAPAMVELMLDRVVMGRKIADPALFRAGVLETSSGLAKILNSIDGGTVEAPLP